MEKDFFGWAKVKSQVHKRTQPPCFGVGQIWWCSLGANVGHEQDGKGNRWTRPVVVLSKFNEHTAVVVPLTGRKRRGRYYLPLGKVGGRPSSSIISQLRLIDSRRPLEKLGSISREKHAAFKKAVTAIL